MKTTHTGALIGDRFGEDMEFTQALHTILAENSWLQAIQVWSDLLLLIGEVQRPESAIQAPTTDFAHPADRSMQASSNFVVPLPKILLTLVDMA